PRILNKNGHFCEIMASNARCAYQRDLRAKKSKTYASHFAEIAVQRLKRQWAPRHDNSRPSESVIARRAFHFRGRDLSRRDHSKAMAPKRTPAVSSANRAYATFGHSVRILPPALPAHLSNPV